jgi:uncharacterized protein with HEPN domain
MPHDDSIYLQHILKAIALIEKYHGGMTQEAFQENPLVQDGIIRQIEIIGEATKKISAEYRRKHSDIPWQDMAGMTSASTSCKSGSR